MSESMEDLAKETAHRLVNAAATSTWSMVKRDFLAFAGKHNRQVDETEARIANAPEGEREAVRSSEKQRWSDRLEGLFAADPRAVSAAQDFIGQTGAGDLVQGSHSVGAVETGGGNAAVITAGAHSTITNRQSKTNVKVSIPIIGPLFGSFAAHPAVAATVTVIIVGGSVAGGVALSQSSNSSTQTASTTTQIQAGRFYSLKDLPPKDVTGDAETVNTADQLSYVGAIGTLGLDLQTAGNLGVYTGGNSPTAAQCKAAVVASSGANGMGGMTVTSGMTICFVNVAGQVGKIQIVDAIPAYLTISASFLK